MVVKRSGPKTSTRWPRPVSTPTTLVMVWTTPLTCGRQASETMAIRKSALLRCQPRRDVGPHHRLLARRLLGPAHDAQAAVEVLDQGGAALHPVAVIAVEDAVDGADLGVMDVAADHAVDAAAARLACHRLFVVGDELDRVLDLVLEVRRQRPVAEAELAAAPVERRVDAQRRAVGPLAQDREPLGVAHDAVE